MSTTVPLTGGSMMRGFGVQKGELVVALGVIITLLVMIFPLPRVMLDLLLSFNLTFSLMVLLLSLYTIKPIEFFIFPSLLLIATLFRLSLNVASTRLILLHGWEGLEAAGTVIRSFGSFVVGGNYVVGGIIFVILVIINFIVIIKGSTRIAEVAARFTLDAMPGKQMSVDAELNAGYIDDHEARRRRAALAREGEFYGAMDGASKFVRGEAVAGLLIMAINIIGGLIIGVVQHGMSLADASQTFTLLTIGEGLVNQIPALFISTAAGLVVSKAASEASIGEEYAAQFVLKPQAMSVAAGIIFLVGLELDEFYQLLDETKSVSLVELESMWKSTRNSPDFFDTEISEILHDENSRDPFLALHFSELQSVMVQAIDALPDKEKLLVSLYYYEELTMKEIGEIMGYTESRISQLHTQAMLRLRAKLREYFQIGAVSEPKRS